MEVQKYSVRASILAIFLITVTTSLRKAREEFPLVHCFSLSQQGRNDSFRGDRVHKECLFTWQWTGNRKLRARPRGRYNFQWPTPRDRFQPGQSFQRLLSIQSCATSQRLNIKNMILEGTLLIQAMTLLTPKGPWNSHNVKFIITEITKSFKCSKVFSEI